MSLTSDDLHAIREILKNELTVTVRAAVKEELRPISGELEALRNDIKDIYEMISGLQNTQTSDGSFQKLSIERKLLKLHAELLEAAKQAGVTLPSNN